MQIWWHVVLVISIMQSLHGLSVALCVYSGFYSGGFLSQPKRMQVRQIKDTRSSRTLIDVTCVITVSCHDCYLKCKKLFKYLNK